MSGKLYLPAASLKSGQLLKLKNAVNQTIICQKGCVWITAEGKPWDVILYKKSGFHIDRPTLTLVTAMADSDITIL